MSYTVEFATKWSDFDMNRHMRHTAYNDYAAEVRIRYFAHVGFPINMLTKDNIGPILFEEFTSFRKEILSGENIKVDVKLLGLSKDKRKWKLRHHIYNSNSQIAAVIEVFGAWIDLEKRKLTVLPEKYVSFWQLLEKTEDFSII
ncbi:MAG: thioesterase family protein [Flavobacteriaceae bacterium]|nr:thioesterase family protein [Flavobacteriaceae bacterium]